MNTVPPSQSKTCPEPNRRIQNLKSKIAEYCRLVRFSHTVFALPFALASVALAWPRHPATPRALLWILVAMVAARTAAMGFNRLADRKFDALNPRTEGWELPRGVVKTSEAIALTTASAAIFVIAAYQLNWICFILSPVALLIVFFYSLTKRFTWASHLFLGLSLSIAPIGAWLAVASPPFDRTSSRHLCFGVAGFSGWRILSSTVEDREFDRAHDSYSIPFVRRAGACIVKFFLNLLTSFACPCGRTAELGLSTAGLGASRRC